MSTGPLAHARSRRLGLKVLALVALWAAVHLVAITVDGLTDEERPADVAVVLGNHVTPAGELSRRLQLRLDRAVALYTAGLAPRVIVSGGQDPGSPPEAEVMKRYLVEQGIPPDHIVEDRGGINTHATARFVAGYLRDHGLRSAIAVSQYYHISRCKLAFRGFGVETTGAHAEFEPELREPWSIARELVGYYTYLFKPYSL